MNMTYNGMTIEAISSCHFTLRYNDVFFVHAYEDNLLTLPGILHYIKDIFNNNPSFTSCVLMDADSGEDLFKITRNNYSTNTNNIREQVNKR